MYGAGLGTDVHSGRVDLIRDFPLFPLGLVALPTELVPLHIFEERYKTMVARVLEEEGEFGIVWVADDGLREIGCACEIADILERMPDGRINLVARGTRPFRIEARQDELAYPAGTIEFLEDEDEPGDPEAAGAAHEAYAELVIQATDHTPDPDELANMTAYEMAATVDFGLDAKQGLLDLRSEAARLALAARLFRAALKRLDFVERAQARARSNGRVRFPA
jgi:Lon protease-like protein